MLKRIKDRFSQDVNNIEKLNKYGYIPTQEEIESDLKWEEIQAIKRKYNFEGNFKCTLCPEKQLHTEQELKEHLESKGHAKNVQQYFRKNKDELEKRINQLFSKQSKRIKKYSQRYKQLSWLSHYYKVKGSLRLK